MKLVIAEKPSVAMALAAVLGADEKKDGYLEGGGYLVSWCVGHLLELAQPEAYGEQYARWRYGDLPILPDEWKYEVPKDKKKQLDLLCRLMKDKRVDSVVCATDAGREGELIFRLVYEYAGCRKPMERLWISSMDNEDETVADEILKQFDLLEYKDRHPLSLSGGQKQRVAIASAIVSNREIIVFDEPTSGLDLKHMWEVARSLKSLADQGKTLLVITHDPELVMAGCSYVVHMEKGQIKESYPLDESGSKKVLDFFRIRQ